VHFHSLPPSKHYPENEDEHAIVLDRYNTHPGPSHLREIGASGELSATVVTQSVTQNGREGNSLSGATLSDLLLRPSGGQDLNLRPLDPQDVGVGPTCKNSNV
jgi:hypothetical protein